MMGPIWCAGMFASGSTWIFNVVRAIAAASGLPVSGRFVGGSHDMHGIDTPDVLQVVKTHEADAQSRSVLLARASHIIVSIRDPRDALTSLMLYQRHSFAQAMQRLLPSMDVCGALASDPRTMLLRFEDGFTDDPATIRHIADKLGVRLSEAAATGIVAAHARNAVERLVASMNQTQQLHTYPGGAYDPRTQWHLHHAGRDGEIGRWHRMLTAEQVAVADGTFGAWMERFRYARAAS